MPAYVPPREFGENAFEGGVAASAPEGVVGAEGCGTRRMIVGPFDRTEGHVLAAERAGFGFAGIEEGVADAATAIFGQEHRLGAVIDLGQIIAERGQGGAKLFGVY